MELDPTDKQLLVQDGYDAIAERYDAGRERFKNRDVLEQFAALVRTGGEVLDVGCGGGVPVAKFLVDQGFAVTGIDISDSMLRLAQERIPQGSYIKLDMTDMGVLGDASFDGIVACYSLIHVPMELHQSVILDFARLLKAGGSLLFSSGEAEWEGIEDFHGTPMFWSHPDPEKTRGWVVDAGLLPEFTEVKEHGGEHHYWVLARKPKR